MSKSASTTYPYYAAPEKDVDMKWFADAACRSMPTELFFSAQPKEILAAKEVCSGCSVRQECLQWAFKAFCWYGVFGGMTARERKARLLGKAS